MRGAVNEAVEARAHPRPKLALGWLGLLLCCAWFALVLAAAYDLTASTVAQLAVGAATRPGQGDSVRFVLVIAAIVLGAVLVARALRPRLVVTTLALVCGALMVALAAGAAALVDLLLLLLLVFAWYELGRLALAALGCLPDDPLEAFALAAGLGSGLFALIGLALGLAGLLTVPALLVPIAALAIGAELRWGRALPRRGMGRGLRRGATTIQRYWTAWRPGWFETILLAIIAVYLLLGYTMGLAPELLSDAIRQHLAIARVFADQHRIAALPHLGQSLAPIGGNVLFAIGMALHGPILAKLVHTAVGALAVAMVGVLGRRYAGATAGIIAAALVATLPATVWELGTGYIDLFVVLYAAGAGLCLLRWQGAGGGRWPFLLGAFLGFGVAAKLTFGFLVIAIILATLLIGREGSGWRERLGALLLAGAGGLLCGGPWLVRSGLLTGQIPGLSLLFDALGRGEGQSPESLANLTGFGIGRTPAALLRLPWEITVTSGRFGENAAGFLGFAFLLLLPTLALLRRGRTTFALATVVLVPFLLWFYSAQYIRYLLPTLALLAPLLGGAFVHCRQFSARLLGVGDRFVAPLLGVALVAVLATPIVFYLATIFVYPGGLPVRLVLGRESPEAYLTHGLPSYSALQRLDREVPPGTPVASLQEDAQMYTHAALLHTFNGTPELLYARTPPELVSLFDRRGIAYVLINRNLIPPSWGVPVLTQPAFLGRHADLVYANNNVYLYRLRPEGMAATLAEPELLQNPGFEEGEGTPTYWNGFGTPTYEVGGTKAYQGRGAVIATNTSGYQQPVRVRAGQAYLLGYVVRSEQPGAAARMQINWLDADGKIVVPKIEVVPVGPEWAQQTMWAEAPPGAATALVYITAHNDVPCWFDDFSFKEAK